MVSLGKRVSRTFSDISPCSLSLLAVYLFRSINSTRIDTNKGKRNANFSIKITPAHLIDGLMFGLSLSHSSTLT